MLTVEEALSKVLARVSVLAPERMALSDALGRVLAEDVPSDRDLPPHDVSQMDGYAVRAADLASASPSSPARLRVVARIFAGERPRGQVGPGEAARIMTGAALPEGADAVVMQEVTAAEGDLVCVRAPSAPGDFVRRRGADLTRGGPALPRGAPLGPAQVALLAAVGRSQVPVFQRPRVAVLSTGDELCEIDARDPEGRIVDSNTWALCAQVVQAGGVPVQVGIVKDSLAAIRDALAAASRCEVVVTSGGVSVGERDFVKDALAELGVTLDLWRVAMKPGKPFAFGVRGEQLFFGLPGNPTSSMVSFEQFVRPALRKLQGHASLVRPRLAARLASPLEKRAGLTHFVRAIAKAHDGRLHVTPVARQDSGLISSMAEANCLIVLPPELERASAGDEVLVELLGEPG